MIFRDLTTRITGKLRSMRGKSYYPYFDADAHTLPCSERERLQEGAACELARLVFDHHGRRVDKWTHYPEIYERYFAKFRGTSARMLEIGVFKGGSLEIWRKYFGPY